jgi:hypothetical protein
MIAAAIGLTIVSLSLSATLSGKQMLRYDYVRTKMNQNLRSGLDMAGLDIRIGGENLTSSFPAFEILDGPSGSADQLIIRRNLIGEILTLCDTIDAGSSAGQIVFAQGDGTMSSGIQEPGCIYGDPGQTQNYTSWSTYRTSNGETSKLAFIYDSITGDGEFFSYTGEGDSGNSLYLTRSAGNWLNTYQEVSSQVIMLEEHRFRLVDGVLQIVVNQNFDLPQNIVTDVTDFQVTLLMNDDTTLTSYDPSSTYDWTDIREVRVTISGSELSQKRLLTKDLSTSFFPRNILSH